MLALFDDLLRRRQHQPTNDVLSLLAGSQEADEHRDDILANCIFFVLAGHDTTTTLITAGVHLLSAHPDQLASILNGQTGWSSTVEELLRFVSPTTLTGVTATQDLQVAGCPVPDGANRAVVLAAANRDPSVFDNPDTFDAARAPNPHASVLRRCPLLPRCPEATKQQPGRPQRGAARGDSMQAANPSGSAACPFAR